MFQSLNRSLLNLRKVLELWQKKKKKVCILQIISSTYRITDLQSYLFVAFLNKMSPKWSKWHQDFFDKIVKDGGQFT